MVGDAICGQETHSPEAGFGIPLTARHLPGVHPSECLWLTWGPVMLRHNGCLDFSMALSALATELLVERFKIPCELPLPGPGRSGRQNCSKLRIQTPMIFLFPYNTRCMVDCTESVVSGNLRNESGVRQKRNWAVLSREMYRRRVTSLRSILQFECEQSAPEQGTPRWVMGHHQAKTIFSLPRREQFSVKTQVEKILLTIQTFELTIHNRLWICLTPDPTCMHP